MKQKTKKQTMRLKDINVQEVSMVDTPANRKKWAVVKSATGTGETQRVLDRYYAAKEGDEDALLAILKELLSRLSPEVLEKLDLMVIPKEPAGETGEASDGDGSEEADKGGAVEGEGSEETVEELKRELEETKKRLALREAEAAKVGEPQSGGDPRPVGKSAEDVKTLGCRSLYE